MADSEGYCGFAQTLRQNCSIFMKNFQKYQEKITNNQVQLTNRTPFVNLNPYQEILDLPLICTADIFLRNLEHLQYFYNKEAEDIQIDNLILTLLNPDIPCFENSADPDQLVSQKQADQDPQCFDPACKYMSPASQLDEYCGGV